MVTVCKRAESLSWLFLGKSLKQLDLELTNENRDNTICQRSLDPFYMIIWFSDTHISIHTEITNSYLSELLLNFLGVLRRPDCNSTRLIGALLATKLPARYVGLITTPHQKIDW